MGETQKGAETDSLVPCANRPGLANSVGYSRILFQEHMERCRWSSGRERRKRAMMSACS